MPPRARPRWHTTNQEWVSDVGEAYVDKSGRVRRRTVAFPGIGKKDVRRAREALAEFLDLRDDPEVPRGQCVFSQVCQLYLIHSERTAAESTYKGHRQMLAYVCDTLHAGRKFGDRKAEEITATDLDRIVQAWAAKKRSPTYISRMIGSVQAAMNWAAAPVAGRDPERLIASNPLKGYTSPAAKIPDAPDRFAERDEVEAFVKWLRVRAARMETHLIGKFEARLAGLIWTGYLSGARPGELCIAEWGDFDPRVEEVNGQWWGRIVLDHTRWKAGRKTGRKRVIYLHPDSVAEIEAIRSDPDRHPRWIWTHKRGSRAEGRGDQKPEWGSPWSSNYLSRKVRNLRREAIEEKVPLLDSGDDRFTFYRLRHSRAAELLAAGVDLYTVGKLLGTSATMVQKRYGSRLQKDLVMAVASSVKDSRDD